MLELHIFYQQNYHKEHHCPLLKYAVISIRNGDDIKTVQNNLGHATASFALDVYGHVTEQMKGESSSRMEGFIQGISGLR